MGLLLARCWSTGTGSLWRCGSAAVAGPESAAFPVLLGRSSPTIARVTERRRTPSPPASTTAHARAASSVTAHSRPRDHLQRGHDRRAAGTPIAEEVDHPIDPARAIDCEHELPPLSQRSSAQPEQVLHCVPHSCVHGVRCFPQRLVMHQPCRNRGGHELEGLRMKARGHWRFRALRSAILHGGDGNRTGWMAPRTWERPALTSGHRHRECGPAP